MITVNIEIGYICKAKDHFHCQSISKQDVLDSTVAVVLDVLEQQTNAVLPENFMITPGADWNQLPKKLYMVMNDEYSTPELCTKTRKKITEGESVVYPVHLIFKEDSKVPDMTMDIRGPLG